MEFSSTCCHYVITKYQVTIYNRTRTIYMIKRCAGIFMKKAKSDQKEILGIWITNNVCFNIIHGHVKHDQLHIKMKAQKWCQNISYRICYIYKNIHFSIKSIPVLTSMSKCLWPENQWIEDYQLCKEGNCLGTTDPKGSTQASGWLPVNWFLLIWLTANLYVNLHQ